MVESMGKRNSGKPSALSKKSQEQKESEKSVFISVVQCILFIVAVFTILGLVIALNVKSPGNEI